MEVVASFKSRPVYTQGYTSGSHLIGGSEVLRAGLDIPEKRSLLSSP
jgi:hypothetical protein